MKAALISANFILHPSAFILSPSSFRLPSRRGGSGARRRVAANQVALGQARSLPRLLGHQRQPDVRLALYVSRHVTADVGARGRAQALEVAAEVVQARRGPPEADRVRLLRELFARVEVVGLDQS